MFAPHDLAPDQSSALQNHQVFGNGIEGNGEGSGDLRDGGRLVGDRSQNGPSDGIGNGRENKVQLRLVIFNHMVEH